MCVCPKSLARCLPFWMLEFTKNILLRKSSSCDPIQANHSKSINVTQFIDRNHAPAHGQHSKRCGDSYDMVLSQKTSPPEDFCFPATQTYSTLFGVTLKWTPWVVQLQTFSKSALARSITDHLNFQFPRHTGTCHLLSIAIHLGARSLEILQRKRRIPICWKDTSAGKPVCGKNWVVIQLSSPRFRVSCHQPVCVLSWKDYLSRDMLQLRK